MLVIDYAKMPTLRENLESRDHGTLAWLLYRVLDTALRGDREELMDLVKLYDLEEFLREE